MKGLERTAEAAVSSAEVRHLRAKLLRLQAYLAVAEYDLRQLGLDLRAARKEGWVTRRARQRREARERRKAAKEKKVAKEGAAKEREREDRKLRGEEVTPSPTPSEVAHQRSKAEATRERRAAGLRNRVRRTELELLIAAAMGKQYRGRTIGGESDPEWHRSRRPTSGTTAKSKKGLETKAKADAVRGLLGDLLGDTPAMSSGTEGSDRATSPSKGKEKEKAAEVEKLPGGLAKATWVYDPDVGSSEEEEGTELDSIGGTIDGLGSLSLDDVDDGLLATLHDTLVVPPVAGQDWADAIFAEMVSGEATTAPRPTTTAFMAVAAPSREELVRKALKHFKASDPRPAGKAQQREPNRPPPPDVRLYDARYWSEGREKSGDKRRVRAAVVDQEVQVVETGFVTWERQEKRFPDLEQRLALQDVSPPNLMIFNPATVDRQVWDPLNRAISEPRTGKRAPLKLNPVTTLSLGWWNPSEHGGLPSRIPLPLPDKPSTEDKKRPMSSAALAHARAVKRVRGVSIGHARRESAAKRGTRQPGHVAAIHYPLNSAAVTSISESGEYDGGTTGAGLSHAPTSAASWSRIRPAPPGPPTPYPRLPGTPTVALYPNAVTGDGEADGGRDTAAMELKPTVSRKRSADDSAAAAALSAGINGPETKKKRVTSSYLQPSVADASDTSISESDQRHQQEQQQQQQQQGCYDLENVDSVHPSVRREYDEAHRELRLRLVDRAVDEAAYARAVDRFERAQSQFKAVLKTEPGAANVTTATAADTTIEEAPSAAVVPRNRPLPIPSYLTGVGGPRPKPKTEKEKEKEKEMVIIPGLSTLYSSVYNKNDSASTRKSPEKPKSVRFNIAGDTNISHAGKPKPAAAATGARIGGGHGRGDLAEPARRAISKLALTKGRLRTL